MGADYYLNTYLVVNHSKDNKEEKDYIEYDRQGCYFWGSYDSDSETDYDKKFQEQMMSRQSNYSDKVIYENNNWLITSKSKIEDYEETIYKSLPGDIKINKIIKHHECVVRN